MKYMELLKEIMVLPLELLKHIASYLPKRIKQIKENTYLIRHYRNNKREKICLIK
jgi:hypothetical protein